MTGCSGHLRLRGVAQADGRTVLREQAFRAPFHLSKPYWDAEARALLVQVVNPTAGILADDRLESRVAVESNAALFITTPSASRVFTMTRGTAECRQEFMVAANGWLEFAPEPLVPHRGSRYRQSTEVEVAEGGGLFLLEQLVPGRIGHGECWSWTELRLELSVRVGGELVLRERFAHTGEQLRRLADLAGSGTAACLANAVLIDPGANVDPRWRDAVAALHGDGVWVGVSALRRAGWTLRIVAPDTIRLRATVAAVRETLASYFPRMRCNARKL